MSSLEASLEATQLFALKWSTHNTFLAQKLYDQCRVSKAGFTPVELGHLQYSVLSGEEFQTFQNEANYSLL